MTANPVYIGRILEHEPHWTWFRLDRLPESLHRGDRIRVRPVNNHVDYPFRTGECTVLGVMGFCVHVEGLAWVDIAAIADMYHVYLTERPRRADVERVRSIDAALDLNEKQRQFDREFPRTPIAAGDRVRWWPDVTDLGTPAAHARYIDGVVMKFDPLCIRVTSSHGFTERCPGGWLMPPVGGVVDTSISLGLVRRRPYAPGEKLTDRHPDSVIAQVVEETLAKHPGLAKLQKRTRPDGFDQRQVDAARAALLAPALPRYPRTR